ncbi:hypothetical protein CPTAKMNP4_029 [Salmonella phage vB_SenM-AKM_NP4]|uniref:Uncharacterized protein n=4 Tax=Gelderlandvirus TaxID=1913653 RepID=M1GU57_BPS16|nr:hypothetical protein I133_gp242 [Salmonella phage vB_SenM-S16]YP_009126233.1 hypothetical protein STP4a_024 [Salmonella phage STP4-a]YP_009148019.1 hypothetical protein ACQ31_gp094 [Salmonella phage STML-198]YP_009615510.1 hypothetical protein FDI73_gp024 [Salmonella phage Melville]UFK27152.1 hypothetical protein LG358_00131 [Escherichia phage UoN_LG358_1]UPW42398.1 hypothetical protein EBPHNEJP_00100 [Salmonella phage CF-SP2]WDR21695.1 hypothetical protein PJM34_0027 [Salmonella phage vB_
MSEKIKTPENKNLKSQFVENKGKLILVGVITAVITAWNYIIIPFALAYGFTLPPIPLDKVIHFIMLGGF